MILGKKLGQTSFLDSKGKRVCATVLDYKGCTVVGNRTNDKDGYIANIIGFLKPKKLNKPKQQDFIKKNRLSFECKSFDPSDINNQTLIVAATNDKETNKASESDEYNPSVFGSNTSDEDDINEVVMSDEEEYDIPSFMRRKNK